MSLEEMWTFYYDPFQEKQQYGSRGAVWGKPLKRRGGFNMGIHQEVVSASLQ